MDFARDPGPLGFLGFEELAGMVTLDPDDPALGNHERDDEADEDDGEGEESRDEDPPDL